MRWPGKRLTSKKSAIVVGGLVAYFFVLYVNSRL